MNLIGKWKISEVMSPDDSGDVAWKSVDKLSEEEAQYAQSIINFTEDGKVETLILIPPEVTQAEIDESGMEVRDGYAVVDLKEWKTEDGKNLYNTGTEGELFGEKVSPWVEIPEYGDGIELVMLRLVRAD